MPRKIKSRERKSRIGRYLSNKILKVGGSESGWLRWKSKSRMGDGWVGTGGEGQVGEGWRKRKGNPKTSRITGLRGAAVQIKSK